ncbi:MAG: MBL fold metallo-hydrolase [Granulosicoccus sp.]|nr:MBL fold metallo-hydrolase [Granulosicoccus sp.]
MTETKPDTLGTPDRRRFLRTATAFGLGSCVPGLVASSVQAAALPVLESGELQIVSDGQLSLPRSFAFPDSADNEELTELLAAHGLEGDTLMPDCNVTLWRHADRLILFDVGAGPNFMPGTGQLLENLANLDIDPMEVTDVVFTHAHPDHLWGVLDDFDELICPNATYHMSAIEWDYWRAPGTLDKTPEARQSFVVGARNRMAVIEQVISLFDAGQEVVPGVEAIATYGHTPGHTSFSLNTSDGPVVLLGDVLTNVAVSFARPDWHTGADQNPEQAANTRLALLERLVAEQTAIVGFHLPHPGVGRVERDGKYYRFAVSG